MEALQRLVADVKMTFMRRVEGAAEKPDAARRQPADLEARRGQGRTCRATMPEEG
jgi:hypothetical protein